MKAVSGSKYSRTVVNRAPSRGKKVRVPDAHLFQFFNDTPLPFSSKHTLLLLLILFQYPHLFLRSGTSSFTLAKGNKQQHQRRIPQEPQASFDFRPQVMADAFVVEVSSRRAELQPLLCKQTLPGCPTSWTALGFALQEHLPAGKQKQCFDPRTRTSGSLLSYLNQMLQNFHLP